MWEVGGIGKSSMREGEIKLWDEEDLCHEAAALASSVIHHTLSESGCPMERECSQGMITCLCGGYPRETQLFGERQNMETVCLKAPHE